MPPAAEKIIGWQRAADAEACPFCEMIDGAFVKTADAMALHNGCNCGLEPITVQQPQGTTARQLQQRGTPTSRPGTTAYTTSAPGDVLTEQPWEYDNDFEFSGETLPGNGLTAEDAAAINRTIGGRAEGAEVAGFPMNRMLRGQEAWTDDMRALSNQLDTAFDRKGETGHWLRAYRGIDATPAQLTDGACSTWEEMIGGAFTEPGYSSMTANRDWALAMGQKLLTLDVDPRVKALWGVNPAEHELFAQRGLRYVVTKIERELLPSIIKGDAPRYAERIFVKVLPPE